MKSGSWFIDKFLYSVMAVIAAMTFNCFSSYGANVHKEDSVVSGPEVTVSLITCWPGPEVYELCGHSALRVRSGAEDMVWNYGVFDFNAPHFLYRFVKGETDYLLAGYPFEWFLSEYAAQRRHVVEQVLDLSPEEGERLRRMLLEESLPENRTYRYNYVKDNCATRIVDRIDSVAGAPVLYPDSVRYGSFRKEMRAYHKDYPWYQFGIDLALGSGLDVGINGRQEMFVPLELMRKTAHARLPDGRPLVKSTVVLNSGAADATLGPSSPLTSPLAVSILVAVISLVVAVIDFRRKRVTRWYYSLFFGILGIVGCLSFFLVFFSSHEATSPNMLILWVNPLQLLMAVCIWWRRVRILAVAVACCNMVAETCLLIVWPLQTQCANPAFFPWIGATLLLSVAYAINSRKESYIINKVSCNSSRSRMKK